MKRENFHAIEACQESIKQIEQMIQEYEEEVEE